jgi:hypothetical protein
MPLIDEIREIYETIETVVRDTLGSNWKCTKADEIRRPGMVAEKVVGALLNSDLVIAVVADIREANLINPNVMYELGIAHSFRKPTIVVADLKHQLPFNIQGVQTIQLDLSGPSFLSDLRRHLQKSLREPVIVADIERRQPPLNPVTTRLSRARIFIEDLPWLWGYCEVLKREREAETVWEITRDLYWPCETLFFDTIKEAIHNKRKHYFMLQDDVGVTRRIESIKNQLQREVSKDQLSESIHFVAIDKEYFVLWPIAVVLFDAHLATASGGIICEPMEHEVGGDKFDQKIRDLYLPYATSGDLEGFQKRLLEMEWTERREEATFDIRLNSRVVGALATSFQKIWNEKILEEAQRSSGDEKAALLRTWVIGGERE